MPSNVTVFHSVCADNKKAQVSATLRVRYYNLRTLKWDEKNVPITIPANSRKAIKIIDGKTLVKKSKGPSKLYFLLYLIQQRLR
jgi:hypothetical protein